MRGRTSACLTEGNRARAIGTGLSSDIERVEV